MYSVVLKGSESEILLTGTNSFLTIGSIHKSICQYFFMQSEIMPIFMNAEGRQSKGNKAKATKQRQQSKGNKAKAVQTESKWTYR